jgi:ribosomal-protein-alanine N-acetyltransferase
MESHYPEGEGEPAVGRSGAASTLPTPPARIAVRRAREADLDHISLIERASFSDPWSRRSFASLLGDRRIFFGLGIGSRGAPVGYVVAAFAADEAEIANLAVDPMARRHGVGAALLDAAIAEARSRGVTAVYLEVRDSNAGARELYASRGFVEVGRRANYYRKPLEDALILRAEV